MSILAGLLRLLIVAVFAAGLGWPAAPARSAPMPAGAHQMMAGAHQMMVSGNCATGHLPQDELCRQHCLGVTLPVGAIGPAPFARKITALPRAAAGAGAARLWPEPEGRPPRA